MFGLDPEHSTSTPISESPALILKPQLNTTDIEREGCGGVGSEAPPSLLHKNFVFVFQVERSHSAPEVPVDGRATSTTSATTATLDLGCTATERAEQRHVERDGEDPTNEMSSNTVVNAVIDTVVKGIYCDAENAQILVGDSLSIPLALTQGIHGIENTSGHIHLLQRLSLPTDSATVRGGATVGRKYMHVEEQQMMSRSQLELQQVVPERVLCWDADLEKSVLREGCADCCHFVS